MEGVIEVVLHAGRGAWGQPSFCLSPRNTWLAARRSSASRMTCRRAAISYLVPAAVSAGGAGFLLHPLDLPGLAILLSAGRRIRKTAIHAVVGGCIGIALRTVLGMAFG